ncbi:MAG: nucleoside 2-deoxyribosyltransferase [Chloroflexota bacterium]
MKIYFAGPLFTPYVRRFIAEQASILRANGMEVFVPHENTFGTISMERVQALQNQGVLPADDSARAALVAVRMLKDGILKREDLGLATIDAQTVFEVDYAGLSSADAVLAILDGTQLDDGTACEIGIFMNLMRINSASRKKGIVGLITDSRGIGKKKNGYGLNFFILGILEEHGVIVDNFEDALQQLLKWDAELKVGM